MPHLRPRPLVVVAIVALGAFALPQSAHAHGVGGIEPSNYRIVVEQGSPGIPEVRSGTIDLGDRIELTNRSTRTVTVLGYENEPYLRIGPDGVFENLRSPATYINRTKVPTAAPPAYADPTSAPEWRKVSSEPVARWHDHRAHWTAPVPASVRARPAQQHVLERWTIPLAVDGTAAAPIAGTITWVPAAPVWPWLLAAGLAAVAVAILSRTRVWRAAWLIALGLLTVGEASAFLGSWLFSNAPVFSRSFAVIYNVVGFLIAALTLVLATRRTRQQLAPLVLLTGTIVLLGTGVPGFDDLTRSQLPTALPYGLARSAVAAAIGLGLGLILGGAQFLRIAPTSRPSGPAADTAIGTSVS